MQLKYGSKLMLCYMDTGGFVFEIHTEDFYEDNTEDIEARFKEYES